MILWTSVRYDNRAYCTETWTDFLGIHNYMRELIFHFYKRVQPAQKKHATPEESSINPTGI